MLERLDHLGGAAVSSYAFEGVDARLSRYSYLVSLLPERIIRELGLSIRLKRRRYSSYTPEPGTDRGLLVDNEDAAATAGSFASIGAAADADAWRSFYADTARVARALFPTVCDPLLTRAEARGALGDDKLWSAIVEQPIGETIERAFASDLVRGVAMTDGLIGTFARARGESLDANRCFLYHVIGGGTGNWDLPVGGMGAVTDELAKAAKNAGATLLTGAEVTSITPDGEVRYRRRNSERVLHGDIVLAGVAPYVLEQLVQAGLRREGPAVATHPALPRPEGAQVKVNLMLSRLPRLRDTSVEPAAAFGGTFHINELYSQLDAAYDAASSGSIPEPLPCEIYCHTLADPSILGGELAASGAQTLTVFALHTPDRLLGAEGRRASRRDARAVAGRGARLAGQCARRADRRCAAAGCAGPAVRGDEDDRGHRGGAADARWQHLPRAAVLAVRGGRRGACHPGSALGSGQRLRSHPALRFRRPARRSGERHRRAQRRDGGAGGLAFHLPAG